MSAGMIVSDRVFCFGFFEKWSSWILFLVFLLRSFCEIVIFLFSFLDLRFMIVLRCDFSIYLYLPL